MAVPFHCVFLESDILKGPVVLAIFPELPVDGINFLLCNDLAGMKV